MPADPHIGSSPARQESLLVEVQRLYEQRARNDAALVDAMASGEIAIDPLALAMFESDRGPDPISWMALSPQRQSGYLRRARVAREFLGAPAHA